MHASRPRLTPAVADCRRAVRESLARLFPDGTKRPGRAGTIVPNGNSRADAAPPPEPERPLVLVALSGGPDSLALAAATAFEAPRAGLRAGAIIVDHGLQDGSADAAAAAAHQAERLGLAPVLVRTVTVGTDGGPEAAARTARYTALADAARESGAAAVLLGHTLDDQAETVLLGLARGSGTTSLQGMSADTHRAERGLDGTGTGGTRTDGTGTDGIRPDGTRYVRPLLGIRRATTVQACADAGLDAWADPHNDDPAFARVRVRTRVLPVLEAELGPGVAAALARTADQLREDGEALDRFAEELIEDLAEHAEGGLSLEVRGLAANPAAVRHRIIRRAVAAEFGVHLGREHTLEVARLVTDWRGQGPLTLPTIRVERVGALIVFSAAPPPPPTADATVEKE